jgi:hypothetical protein
MTEKKSANKVTKSILNSSPVLLAVALALVFSFSTVANHEETDDVIGVIDDTITPPPSSSELHATSFYNDYLIDEDNTMSLAYLYERVTLTGVLVNWAVDEALNDEGDKINEDYVTLRTDSDGGDRIKCQFPQGFVPDLMDDYMGQTVTITGTLTGFFGGYLVFDFCESSDIFLETDDIKSA